MRNKVQSYETSLCPVRERTQKYSLKLAKISKRIREETNSRKGKLKIVESQRSKLNIPNMDDRKSVMRGPKETRKNKEIVFD